MNERAHHGKEIGKERQYSSTLHTAKMSKPTLQKFLLQLVNKHFSKKHKFHKIFNRNTVKVSYSCMENMASIIIKHNKKILNSMPQYQDAECSCKRKDKYPLEKNCLTQSVSIKPLSKQKEFQMKRFPLISQKAPLKSDFTITS